MPWNGKVCLASFITSSNKYDWSRTIARFVLHELAWLTDFIITKRNNQLTSSVDTKPQVMFCAPTNFNNQVTSKFVEMFFETFKVRAVSMVSQTLLALYSYKVDTGIVVDIGEKIEILPVIDGWFIN